MLTQLVLAQLFIHAFSTKLSAHDAQAARRSLHEVNAARPTYLGRRGVLEEEDAGRRVKIAKQVPAERPAPFPSRVPRVIWQSWKSDGLKDPKSLWVPRERADMMLTWLEKNPTYEYRLLDDEDMETYVANNFDQRHLTTLQSMNQGASKVDFWRVLVMHREGGVYFDTDSGCNDPLDGWIKPQTTYVSGIGGQLDFHQWGIITAPGNCIMKQTAELIMQNVQEVKRNGDISTDFRGLSIKSMDSSGAHASFVPGPPAINNVLGMSGPPVLMRAANKCLEDPASRATTLPGLEVCDGDFFGDRAIFKGPGKNGQPMASTWKPGKLLHFSLNNASSMTAFKPCAQLILD